MNIEQSRRSGVNENEQQILMAMATADPEQRAMLNRRLVQLRAARRTATVAQHDAALPYEPTVGQMRHTSQTDWIDRIATTERADDEMRREAITEAQEWLSTKSALVRSDAEELHAQASGYARMWAGQFGPQMGIAQEAFLGRIARLTQGATELDYEDLFDEDRANKRHWEHADGKTGEFEESDRLKKQVVRPSNMPADYEEPDTSPWRQGKVGDIVDPTVTTVPIGLPKDPDADFNEGEWAAAGTVDNSVGLPSRLTNRRTASNYYLDMKEDADGNLVDIDYYHSYDAPPEVVAQGEWPSPDWPDYDVYCAACGELIHGGIESEGSLKTADKWRVVPDVGNPGKWVVQKFTDAWGVWGDMGDAVDSQQAAYTKMDQWQADEREFPGESLGSRKMAADGATSYCMLCGKKLEQQDYSWYALKASPTQRDVGPHYHVPARREGRPGEFGPDGVLVPGTPGGEGGQYDAPAGTIFDAGGNAIQINASSRTADLNYLSPEDLQAEQARVEARYVGQRFKDVITGVEGTAIAAKANVFGGNPQLTIEWDDGSVSTEGLAAVLSGWPGKAASKTAAGQIDDDTFTFTLSPGDDRWIGNFTDRALDAMIAFWGSPEGQSVQQNIPGYADATLKLLNDEKIRRQGSRRTAASESDPYVILRVLNTNCTLEQVQAYMYSPWKAQQIEDGTIFISGHDDGGGFGLQAQRDRLLSGLIGTEIWDSAEGGTGAVGGRPVGNVGSLKTAGNPYPVGSSMWFGWEDDLQAGEQPEGSGPFDSGAPGGGIPLRGPLTPEQQTWLDKRGSKTAVKSTDCINGNHSSCTASSCTCSCHDKGTAKDMSGACGDGDHDDCKMTHGHGPDDCQCATCIRNGVRTSSRTAAGDIETWDPDNGPEDAFPASTVMYNRPDWGGPFDADGVWVNGVFYPMESAMAQMYMGSKTAAAADEWFGSPEHRQLIQDLINTYGGYGDMVDPTVDKVLEDLEVDRQRGGGYEDAGTNWGRTSVYVAPSPEDAASRPWSRGEPWSLTCPICGKTETGTDYYNGWPSQDAFHNHLFCGADPDANYHQDLAIDRYSLRTAADDDDDGGGMKCSVCGDAIEKNPGEDGYHHDNGEKHDHEAKPDSSKTSAQGGEPHAYVGSGERCRLCGFTRNHIVHDVGSKESSKTAAIPMSVCTECGNPIWKRLDPTGQRYFAWTDDPDPASDYDDRGFQCGLSEDRLHHSPMDVMAMKMAVRQIPISEVQPGDVLVQGPDSPAMPERDTVESVDSIGGAMFIIDFANGTSTAPMANGLVYVAAFENPPSNTSTEKVVVTDNTHGIGFGWVVDEDGDDIHQDSINDDLGSELKKDAGHKTADLDMNRLGEAINAQEFDHCFTLHPDGTIIDASGVYAPSVYHDESNDIEIDGSGWTAMTGLTGQYGYSGAVMHSSEFIGSGVASAMMDLVEDGPKTFVITSVEVLSDDPDASENEEPAGWTILYRDARTASRTAEWSDQFNKDKGKIEDSTTEVVPITGPPADDTAMFEPSEELDGHWKPSKHQTPVTGQRIQRASALDHSLFE